LGYNIFKDPDVCTFIAVKDGADSMRGYFKLLSDYHQSYIGHKFSDISEKSGNSEESGIKSPLK
jgi:hypothetical protein